MTYPDFHAHIQRHGVLVDTNLLVLYVIGSTKLSLIRASKRTSSFQEEDYHLLLGVLGTAKIFTCAHVMTEVSNLIDLNGNLRTRAFEILQAVILISTEPHIPSSQATKHSFYFAHGLTDAAIAEAAMHHKCGVLTVDALLAHRLNETGLPAVNFNHLRAFQLEL